MNAEEARKSGGYWCCGPWLRHGHDRSRLVIGIVLILIGMTWFAASNGWIELTWIQAIPFWPVMVTICGIWMVSRGLGTREDSQAGHRKEG